MRAAGPATAAVTSRNGASGETDWEHYFGAVRRRKWTVIGVTLLGTAVGLLALPATAAARIRSGMVNDASC